MTLDGPISQKDRMAGASGIEIKKEYLSDIGRGKQP